MLRDPDRLRECIPGCQSLDLQPDGRYLAKIQAGVASIKGTFTGHVQISDEQEPTQYRLIVEGSGGPGFVKGDAMITLATADGGATQVSVAGDGQVGGMIGALASGCFFRRHG